jgi:DNA gyrase subunit B
VPGLELVIRDLRGDQPVEEKFRHDGGITEFCEFLAHDEPITDVRRLQGSECFTETVPMLDDVGHMTPQDVERDLGVDVALRWGTGYDTEVRSFVNVIATPKGGTHLSRLRGGADQDVQRGDARLRGCSRPTTPTWSRTTFSRA